MRCIIGAGLCLAVIIAACFFNARYMGKITAEAAAITQRSVRAAQSGDMEEALRTAEELRGYWQSLDGYLSVVLVHAEIENIKVTLSEYVSAAKNGDFDSFFTSAQLLLEFFSHVADIERLKWGNVL